MSAAAAAIIAAEAARRMREEEETMTPYSHADIENGWEFKIVRSITACFQNPADFKKLIDEEARADWTLVEKFDNQRVRFKRPVSARERDQALPPDVDPYRTHYGMSNAKAMWWGLGAVLGFVAIIFAIIVAIAVVADARLKAPAKAQELIRNRPPAGATK